jgi:hypothetical protein
MRCTGFQISQLDIILFTIVFDVLPIPNSTIELIDTRHMENKECIVRNRTFIKPKKNANSTLLFPFLPFLERSWPPLLLVMNSPVCPQSDQRYSVEVKSSMGKYNNVFPTGKDVYDRISNIEYSTRFDLQNCCTKFQIENSNTEFSSISSANRNPHFVLYHRSLSFIFWSRISSSIVATELHLLQDCSTAPIPFEAICALACQDITRPLTLTLRGA